MDLVTAAREICILADWPVNVRMVLGDEYVSRSLLAQAKERWPCGYGGRVQEIERIFRAFWG